ncbi:YfcC family protein, partial [Enterococcus faecalis]
RHKKILMVFAFCFVIMIVSLIPWNNFGVTIFKGWTSVLTGNSFGDWYFGDLAMWFLLLGIIAALIGRFTEKETIEAFMDGAKDM